MCLMAVFVPHRSNKYFHVIVSNGIVSSSAYISWLISNRIGSRIRTIRDADVGTLRSVRSQRCRYEIARSSCWTSVLGIRICFWPFIVRQHAPVVNPWPCRSPQRPTARAV